MNESNKSSQVNSDLLHHVRAPVAHIAIATRVGWVELSGSTVAVAVAEAVATTVDVRNSQLALMKQQTHKIRN